MFYIDCRDVYATLNILKTIELYILNGYIVWYVNYISIKLFKAKKKKEKDFVFLN